MSEHVFDAPRPSRAGASALALVAQLRRRTAARLAARRPLCEVGGGPIDQLCAEQGPSRVVIVAGAEVYSCDAARFAEGRGS